MKKLIIILLTLFSLSASSQIVPKVIKVQGVGGVSSGITKSQLDSVASLKLDITTATSTYEPKITPNTAFNKNFGSNTGDVIDAKRVLDSLNAIENRKLNADYQQPLYFKSPIYYDPVDTTVKYKNIVDIFSLPDNIYTGSFNNSNAFIQNNIISAGNYQFVMYINADSIPVIAKRNINTNVWQTVLLDSLLGKVVTDINGVDGHGNLSIGIDKNGYLHISGNEHNIALKYYVSKYPLDISAWENASMIGSEENSVTYPRFFTSPDSTLFFYYRNGTAGNGSSYINKYNGTTWERQCQLTTDVDGDTTFSFYENRIVFDKLGRLHISGLWRAPGSAAFNQNICYFYSDDDGVTWYQTNGTSYSLPISQSASEPIFSTEDSVGLINQVGMDVDSLNRPIFVYPLNDDDSNTQLFEFYLNSGIWHKRQLTNWSSGTWLFSNVSDGKITRPSIFSYNGKTYCIYSQHLDASSASTGLQIIDITPEDDVTSFTLFSTDLGQYEMTYDPVMVKKGILSALICYVSGGLEHKYPYGKGVVMNLPLSEINKIKNDTDQILINSNRIAYIIPVNSSLEYLSKSDAASKYVTNTELSYKANDSDVIHKTGNESISGNKTFLNTLILNSFSGTINMDGSGFSANRTSFSVGNSYSGGAMTYFGDVLTFNSADRSAEWIRVSTSGGISLKTTVLIPTISNSVGNFVTRATSNGRIYERTASQVLGDIGAQPKGASGKTTLIAGTKSITISGVTTSSTATLGFVSIGGTVSTTWQYKVVCTTNTITITAIDNTGATNTSDTSTLNYYVVY
jgi:hypothetical protein